MEHFYLYKNAPAREQLLSYFLDDPPIALASASFSSLPTFSKILWISIEYCSLVSSLGVSINKLSQMIYAARDNGAYGAKLSGAGGGDCIIALASAKNVSKIGKAIERVGGTIIKVKANTEGVRVEKNK
jgi:galactokinase/mevalonate kinase-like predicted kinase